MNVKTNPMFIISHAPTYQSLSSLTGAPSIYTNNRCNGNKLPEVKIYLPISYMDLLN